MVLSTTDGLQVRRAIAERRVSLSVDWAGYQTIRSVLGNKRAAHLAYYNGMLEIMSPSEAHENPSGLIGQFIEILTEELNLNIKTMGSTTLECPEAEAGAEPDQGYYIKNEPKVRGKKVDFKVDPPPDLVVEVDITHTDINKNALYAELKIPEFWRYNGEVLRIYQLEDDQYKEVENSPTFSTIPKDRLYDFLNACAQQGETKAKRDLRVWMKTYHRESFST